MRSNNSYTIEEVRGIITSKNCYLVSRTYKNRETKLVVGCSRCKKQWKTTLKHFINKEYPCKLCGFNTAQMKLYNIIRTIFNDALLNFKNFTWLKTKDGGQQEIDIYIPSLKLAIEYDGEQHFRPVCFGGISKERAQKNLIITQKRDKRKDTEIKNHPEDVLCFVRFNYKEKLTYSNVLSKLKQAGLVI